MGKARAFEALRIPARAGVGLKPEHYQAILSLPHDVGWFEIHAENYMGAGGPPHRYLTAIRERFPLSVHGVGLSIGAARNLDKEHLRRVKRLVDRYQPALFSEHLAWSTHDSLFFNDLLPMPYTEESVDRVADHIDQVQETLQRQMLLENPSTYVMFLDNAMNEIEFLEAIAERTGCGLLLDVNNVHVSATNQRWDPIDYINRFPVQRVGEIHLAGYAPDRDDHGNPLFIDAHDRPVDRSVMVLYEQTIAKTGALPTLFEWDNDVPDWSVLVAEAGRIDRVLSYADSREEDRLAVAV